MNAESSTTELCRIDAGRRGRVRCRCGGELTPQPSEVPNLDDVDEVRCAATGAVVGNYACEGHCDARIWWTENPKLDPDYEDGDHARYCESQSDAYWTKSDDYDPRSPLEQSDDLALHWDGYHAKFSVLGSDTIRGWVLSGGEWEADHQACWSCVDRVQVVAIDVEGRWMRGVYGREATVVPG